PDYHTCVDEYYSVMRRKGVTPAYAKRIVNSVPTTLAATLVRLGKADAMLTGAEGSYITHLRDVRALMGEPDGQENLAAAIMLVLRTGTYFITDTHVNVNPTPQQIANATALVAKTMQNFGIEPKAALLSHSNFGSRQNKHAGKMQEVLSIMQEQHPDVVVDGEMHADTALSQEIRDRLIKESAFKGAANLLVCPSLNSGNIAYNMVKVLGDGIPVGPILVGTKYPAHIMSESVTVRGIVNMATVAAVDAISRKSV
ncbi:MAG: phosphate acyltransferase, partial [Thiolinea sp.]